MGNYRCTCNNIINKIATDFLKHQQKIQEKVDETQTDTTIKPDDKLSNSKTNPWSIITDNSVIKIFKTQETNNKISSNTQTQISFCTNKDKLVNKFKLEYERKKRYENHINILIAHSEANTTPNSLSRNNFPSALITTDIILNRTLNKLIETTQQQCMQITMKRLQKLIIEIEINLLKIKKDL